MDTHGIPEREFMHYLEVFRKADYFAVIKAGGECLNDYLLGALTELHGLGLYPILVHGGGKQIDEAMDAEGIGIKKIGGKRVTDERTMKVVSRVLEEVNSELVCRLNRDGSCSEGINGVFYVDGKDPVYGYVGNITGMDRKSIDLCLLWRHIPIISSLGIGPGGEAYNQNADSAFRFLVELLRPEKSVSLTPAGGVMSGGGIISEMDHEGLLEFLDSGHASGGMRPKLEEVASLVRAGFSVQVTSPEHLMVELFSEKGLGTYIKGMEPQGRKEDINTS